MREINLIKKEDLDFVKNMENLKRKKKNNTSKTPRNRKA